MFDAHEEFKKLEEIIRQYKSKIEESINAIVYELDYKDDASRSQAAIRIKQYFDGDLYEVESFEQLIKFLSKDINNENNKT